MMHNIHCLCSVYIAFGGKIIAEVILPLAEHDWLK